jgi:hypothetical protein
LNLADLQTGKGQTSFKKKRPSVVHSKMSPYPSSHLLEGVDVMMLVKEVARSKDETIQAKDQMIRLLESVVARKACVCGAE